MTWTIEGKSVLVTGGSSGIGYETALALSKAGAELVLTSRSSARAEAAAKRISAESGRPVVGLALDLSSRASINGFADALLGRSDRLDVLFNNAGALFRTRGESAEGIEMTWAVNHLGPFLLTARLLPLLQGAGEARIVTTSSGAHHGGQIDLGDFGMNTRYSSFAAYGRSKLGNVLFTSALARRLAGTGITANCLHPGLVATGFFHFMPLVGPIMPVLMRPFSRSPQKGAETAIFLIADDSISGQSGVYYHDRRPARVSAVASDRELQERVWELSVEQTGAEWGF